jgi:SAM-dependent methyltransferase
MRDEIYVKMYAVEDRHWWYSAKRRIILALLDRYLSRRTTKRPLRLADLGCGCGRTLQELPDGIAAVGLDSSPAAVAFCRSRGVAAEFGSLPDDVPLEHGTFDAVVLSDVLEHIDDDAGAARAAAGLLAPGGIMIITVPALPRLWSDWDEAHMHKRRYTRTSLAMVFEGAGLDVEFISYSNAALLPAAVAVRLLCKGRATDAQLAVPPRPLNALLRLVFAAERHLLGRAPLPFGLSLAAVLRKPRPTAAVAAGTGYREEGR